MVHCEKTLLPALRVSGSLNSLPSSHFVLYSLNYTEEEPFDKLLLLTFLLLYQETGRASARCWCTFWWGFLSHQSYLTDFLMDLQKEEAEEEDSRWHRRLSLADAAQYSWHSH